MMAFEEDGPTPLFWQTARRCLDFDGKPIHFPRGDFHTQMSTEWGRIEMDSIEILWSMGKTLSRWAKGFDFYQKTAGMDAFDSDERRMEALKDWYEKQQING